MADKLRVHILSKELGVTSKAILAKCKVEGVEGITNHMSTVSAGLAETIREWFSEESAKTSVETAAPVDLAKVRIKRSSAGRRKKQAITKQEDTEAAVSSTAVAEPEPQVELIETPAQPVTPSPADEEAATEAPPAVEKETSQEVVTAAEEPVATPELTPSITIEEKGEPTVEAAPPEPVELAPAAEAPKPKAPQKPVKPAGPQNVPAPAQMRGPKVVGFAKPDPIRPPVPRSTARPPRQSAASGEPGTVDLPGQRRTGRGKVGESREGLAGKKSRQRLNPRRSGRSLVEVGERLREWNDRDLVERQERIEAASGRGIHARRAHEQALQPAPTVIAPRKTKAQITEPIIVHELCAATGIGMMQLMPKMRRDFDLMIARNTVIPTDIAQVAMLDFGVELEVVKPKTGLNLVEDEFAASKRKNLKPRPPVVTMLGHVDHGKTSLLDAIRRTSVVSGEAGGITQHIGAYHVDRGDLSVTFLDTPGHEAFTAMRARGANMTDVVVLVVAADDGVMPQTIEAINHAKAAEVMIVVALNKIDLPGVDLNKVYGQLAEHGLAPTEWGGETDVVKTSASSGEGIEELITHLATLTEILDLKADPTVLAMGTVVEAQMQTGVGPVARVLVREGTLKTGDFLLCGPGAGRVRMIRDDRGKPVKKALPGMPVEVAGLDEVPSAGDHFYCLKQLQRAKAVAAEVKDLRRQASLGQVRKAQTLEDLFRQREAGALPELNLILRADVQGSIDAIMKSLNDIPSDQVKLHVLHTGLGTVSESDVVLAEASGALVVGFNVAGDASTQRKAENAGVDIRLYRVIYDLIDDIRKALEGLLSPDQTEEARGKAEVREIFHVSKVGVIAGCIVGEGTIVRTHSVRVVRDGTIILPTESDVKNKRHRAIASLRRFKDDAKEVRAGMECGIRIEGFDDVKPGDIIEAYEVVEKARTL